MTHSVPLSNLLKVSYKYRSTCKLLDRKL